MSRFDEMVGLSTSNSTDPKLGLRLRDLGTQANKLLTDLKRAASTGSPAAVNGLVNQLTKIIGEMNGIAKRL